MRLLARLRDSDPALLPCALIAAALAAALFLLQGRLGFNVQDEAFLWYGSIRTHAGELPLRDFRSYDPGRYLWCAAWMSLLGDGVVAVRAACWIFGAIGLACGLLAARRALPSRAWLLPAGVLLALWMQPHFKLFESGLAMAVVYAGTLLVERPSAARHFAAGAVAGAAAFFGRNLGLYAGASLCLLTALLAWRGASARPARNFVVLGLGVAAGYAPMLALILFAPGFREAFVDSIAFYARQGALNAELPVPWPWDVPVAGRAALPVARDLSIGALFVFGPLLYATALVLLLRARRVDLQRLALPCAATFVGLAWAHHATVRSDAQHLAQAIHPGLLLALALPAALGTERVRGARVAGAAVLALLTFLAVVPWMPAVRRSTARGSEAWVTIHVGSDRLGMPRFEGLSLARLHDVVVANVPADEPLWVSAHYLGLYPMLGRRSPTWDIYPVWSADDAEQDRMLRELAPVRWAVVDARGIANEESMKLSRTHPHVWEMLMREFERRPLPGAPESLLLLRRRAL